MSITRWPVLNRRWEGVALVLILLLAAFLRFARLDTVPPGVTHDEAAHLQDARRIWEGARPLYLESANGREPFYDYVVAPLVGWVGLHVFVGRFVSALWGILLVSLSYSLLKRCIGRAGAMSAALFMAVSFWPLSTSRQVLRSITMPTLLTAALLLFWQALYAREKGRRRAGWFAAAGFVLGLSFYTYMPARVTWLVPLLLWASLVWTDRPRWRSTRGGMLLLLGVMAAVAAPLLLHLALHPGLETRVTELAQPLQAAWAGEPDLLLERMAESVGMFSHRGDTHWMYNLSGRPLLSLPLAILFYVGLGLAVVRVRRPGPRLLLLWLLVGISPALVTGLESSSLRAIAAQPAVFGLCALPLALAVRMKRVRLPVLILVVGLAGWVAADTAQTYFVEWAGHPDVRVAYHTHLLAEANYLERAARDEPVAVSTFYPAQPHDPAAMETLLESGTDRLSWFDGRGGLVFPVSEHALLLVPSAVPLDPLLEELVSPFARPLEPILLRPVDFVTQVEVMEWDAGPAFQSASRELTGPVGFYPQPGLPSGDAQYRALSLPVNVGDRLQLAGYRLPSSRVVPGEEIALLTLWESRGAGEELVLFTHLLDGNGHVWAQADRLDVPAWGWRAGQGVAQVHRLRVSLDTPPGSYHLQVGVYRAADGSRLPVQVAGEPVDDRILLQSVEVYQP